MVLLLAFLSTFASCKKGVTITVVDDKRCKDCQTQEIIAKLKEEVKDAEIKVVDYSDSKGKKMFKELSLGRLPAVLFSASIKDHEANGRIGNYLEKKGDQYLLRIGSQFDPEAEICDNKLDDNGNSRIDCDDDSCKGSWLCMEKREKPSVDMFVMSHCPYGTQIEKGMIPVMKLLKDKADIKVRFCSYAMHGKKELDEQLGQYCIQKKYSAKLVPYLECFLEADEGAKCLKKAGIPADGLLACVKEADKRFAVTKGFNDRSTWTGNFPGFNVDKELTDKYGVQGSPTLVVNGVQAESGRSPADLLAAVCRGFKNPPKECEKQLNNKAPSPGFGWKGEGGGSGGGCGAG